MKGWDFCWPPAGTRNWPLTETRKQNAVIPEEFRAQHNLDGEREDAREFYKVTLESLGHCVINSHGWRKGAVETPGGVRAHFPFVMVDAATKWWDPVGNFTYRWLCSFTHASYSQPSNRPVPVAALDEANAYLVLHLVTDSLWKAMDAYSMWLGMPNGIVRSKMERVFDHLEASIPENMRLTRPPTPTESWFLGVVAVMEDLGFVSKKTISRFAMHYVRRLGKR